MEILKKAGPHGLAFAPSHGRKTQLHKRASGTATCRQFRHQNCFILGARPAWEPRAGGRLIS